MAERDRQLFEVECWALNVSDSSRGWGVGPWGRGTWGTPRANPSATRILPPDYVSLDTYGENLIAMGSADGRLLQWPPDIALATDLVAIAGAPTGRFAITTEQRSIMVLGAAGDPRRVQWCSLEDTSDWTSTPDNTAGEIQVRHVEGLRHGARVREGVLVWSFDELSLMRFVGYPYTYEPDLVGSGVGAASAGAIITAGGVAWWMGRGGFWRWEGAPVNMPCPVQDYVFARLNQSYIHLTAGYRDPIHNELWWFYVSTEATEPDSYVMVDSAGQWFIGHMGRTAGLIYGIGQQPMAASADGRLFQHEVGWLGDGQSRVADIYAQSGDVMIGEGERNMVLSAIYPDAEPKRAIKFDIAGKFEAEDELLDFGSFPPERSDGVIDALLEARMLQLTLRPTADGPWRLGNVALRIGKGAGA